jgi:hypothetical protein
MHYPVCLLNTIGEYCLAMKAKKVLGDIGKIEQKQLVKLTGLGAKNYFNRLRQQVLDLSVHFYRNK